MTDRSTYHLHRRQVLTGLGGIWATLIVPGPHARAAIPPFRRTLGTVELLTISDGTLNAPLSFTLPETPPAEAAALLTSHGLSAGGLPSQTNVTLVKTENEVVLIDAGSGSNFQDTAGKLAENMEAAGIDPASITKVAFTHGHADHLWGAIDDFDDSARFPNATYIIAATEWDFWTDPDTVTKVPDWLKGMARGSARILRQLESKIERRKPGDALAPGLSYVGTPGHTPGHMAVMVESGGELLLIGGDVLTHTAVSFARPAWRIGSDHDHDRAVATRKQVLDQLVADRLPLIGFHLPWPGHGVVERHGAAYRFIPT